MINEHRISETKVLKALGVGTVRRLTGRPGPVITGPDLIERLTELYGPCVDRLRDARDQLTTEGIRSYLLEPIIGIGSGNVSYQLRPQHPN